MSEEPPKFEAQDQAIDAANILAHSQLFENDKEAAKFIVAEVLKSANAWGVIEDVLFYLLSLEQR